MISLLRRSLLLGFAAVLMLAVIAPARAGSPDFVRDEFNAVAYNGGDGSVPWGSNWLEAPVSNGPAMGELRVVSDSHCAATNCLRFGPNDVTGRGAYREVDLTESTSAHLVFSFRRQLDQGGDGRLLVRASTDGWAWNTVGTYYLNKEDSGDVTQSLDLSPWVGSAVKIGFFGDGDFGGYFFIDDVQVLLADNANPSLDTLLPDRTDIEGDTVGIPQAASDPDDVTLSFSASGLPPGVSIDTDTGTISGTIGHTAAASSPHTTVVTVADGQGGSDSDSFVWTVEDLNRAPTLEAIPNTTAEEMVASQITVTADDPDLPGDALHFSLTSAPTGASISPAGVITWTPAESNGPGTYGFTVKVKDSANPPASVVRSFSVTVVEVNTAPEVAYIPDHALVAGDSVSYTVLATDPDIPPNSLTFAATGLPPGILINQGSGLMRGTIPSDADTAAGTATVMVNDDGTPRAETIETFAWQVTIGNHAPVLEPIPDQNPESGGSVSFTAVATDADNGDRLNFWLADGIDPVPAGALINPDTGAFDWVPTEPQHGATYRINIGVSDSGSPRLSDTQLVTIVVPKINEAPEVTKPEGQSSDEGDAVALTAEASDPDDDDTLRFAASGLPDGLSIDGATGTISGTVGYDAAAGSPYAVTITARDNGKPVKSGKTSFEWKVANTNRAPTATSIDVISILGEVTPIVLAVDDPDGDELEFEIVVEPIFGVLEGTGPEMTYTSSGGVGRDFFSFVVSDGEFEADAEVRIEIRSDNHGPTASPDAYTVAQGELLEVVAPGVLRNDSDLDGELLTAALVAGPDHGRLDFEADGSFTFLPDEGFSGGDKFIYSVADALEEQDTATVVLTVTAAAVVAPPVVTESPRADVVNATSPLWRPPTLADDGLVSQLQRAVVAGLSSVVSTLPALRYPLLLLAIVLLLALTIGRVSYLPTDAAKQEEGIVESYDELHSLGSVVPVGGGEEVFVYGPALENAEILEVGERVEYVAAPVEGRRIALRAWPATS